MALTAAQSSPEVAVPSTTGAAAVVLRLGSTLGPTLERAFDELCRLNPDLRLELTAEGDLCIMSPVGGGAGKREFTLSLRFGVWAEANGSGISFSPSTGFTLPSGARRSPDVAWIRRERWETLTAEEQETFPPLCPDFVVELRSPSDPLKLLQEKMEEYMASGAQLGWLIDPLERKVHVYRPSEAVLCLENPERISGDPMLAGFVLILRDVWG